MALNGLFVCASTRAPGERDCTQFLRLKFPSFELDTPVGKRKYENTVFSEILFDLLLSFSMHEELSKLEDL